jgi:hypothetical protein
MSLQELSDYELQTLIGNLNTMGNNLKINNGKGTLPIFFVHGFVYFFAWIVFGLF